MSSRPEAQVSLTQLKALARRNLPAESPTRAAIISQPDEVPEGDAGPLAKALSRMLSTELLR